MIRFLHTADWQIGTQFGQFDAEEAAHLAEARFETVRRIASEAAERRVDAVLVAGDVFDQQTVSDTVIRRLFGALAGFAGPWIMLPGNHDAALVESVWTRAQRLNCIPANVRVVLTPGVVLLDELKCAFLCAPLTQRITYDDTTAFFDQAESPPGYFRVGLAHGSVSGILQEGIDSTNPIAPTRAASARLDYLALGDWHGHFSVNERTWYAGTHEQDRFRANDPGFMLDVTLQEPGAMPDGAGRAGQQVSLAALGRRNHGAERRRSVKAAFAGTGCGVTCSSSTFAARPISPPPRPCVSRWTKPVRACVRCASR